MSFFRGTGRGNSLRRWCASLRRKQRRPLNAESLERRSLLASIQGTVFNDLDADQIIDAGESRLQGWQVYLDENDNGVLDTNAATVERSSTNVPRSIPDQGFTTSNLSVGGLAGIITDLDVKLTINHTWDEDVEVFLTSPGGTRVELINEAGGSADNFTDTILDDEASQSIDSGFAPFTGSFRPLNPLDVYDAQSPNGVWLLEVFDDNADDTGRLVNWSLIISTQSFDEPVSTTDSAGAYSFPTLVAGPYKLGLAPQTGWNPTSPAGGFHLVTLGATESVGPLNFGQRQPPSTLRGTMWSDFDGDGVRDGGEPGLAGQRVFLDTDNDGVLDSQTIPGSFSNSVGGSIPDNGVLRSPLTVPTDLGRIIDLDVSLDITHPNVSDLEAYLVSPSGTRVQLFASVGGTGDDFTNTTFDDSAATAISAASPPFTGTFQPAEPFSAMHNQSARGTWLLEVRDTVSGNVGTLENWSLSVRRLDAERSVLTDATGAYVFGNLGPGTYDVVQSPISGFTPTAPRSVTLQPQQTINVSRASNAQEHQPSVAVDPSDPSRLFIVSNLGSGNGFFAATSIDGGATWSPRTLTGTDGLPLGATDPDVAFDDFGNLFLAYVQSGTDEIVFARSDDGGQTFSDFSTFGEGEKPSIVAAEGAVWVSYTGLNDFFVQIEIKVTGAPVTGLGVVGTFTSVAGVPGSVGSSYSDLAIGPGGEVMVAYQTDNGNGAASIVRTNVDPDGLGPAGFNAENVAATTNVGTSNPIAAQSFYNVNASVGIVWDRTGGPRNGRAYMVYTDEVPEPSQDLDVLLQFSDDQGATWSSPQRVNDDDPGDPIVVRSQFLPEIALDPVTGDVAVVWYDARNDDGVLPVGGTDFTANNDVHLFGTLSIDGGVSFLPNLQVATGFTNAPRASSPRGFGDTAGLVVYDGVLYPVWVDNSNSTGNNPNGALADFDIYSRSLRAVDGGLGKYRVIAAPATVRNDLHFASHRNPVLAGFPAVKTNIENKTTQLAGAAVVTQVTSPHFGGGSLTVRVANNAELTDRLLIRNQGSGAGQVSVTGTEVRVSNVVVGTFVGGASPSPLVITFNANASGADVQAVIRNILFRSVSNNPSVLPRQITFDLTDGHRGTSNTTSVQLNIQAVNDRPRITNLGTSALFEEDLPPVRITTTAVVTDPDSFDFGGGQLTVTITENAKPTDALTVRSVGTGVGQISVSGNQVSYEGTVIATLTGGNGSTPLVLSFNASAGVTGVQALVRSVEFSTAGDNPSGLTRKVSFVLSDGDGGTSPTALKSVRVRRINDAPVISLAGNIGYVANTAPIAIATSATLTDADSKFLNGGFLRVSIGDGAHASNRLQFGGGVTITGDQVSLNGTVIGTINQNGGVGITDLVVTFNTNATVARVQQLIRSVRFRTVASPNLADREVQFIVSDGLTASDPAIRTVVVQ